MDRLISTVEEVAAHLDRTAGLAGCTFPDDGWKWCSTVCEEGARCLKSVAADLRAALNEREA